VEEGQGFQVKRTQEMMQVYASLLQKVKGKTPSRQNEAKEKETGIKSKI